MDRTIEIARKLGITAWAGVWGGLALGIILLSLLTNLGQAETNAQHKASIERLEGVVERQSVRLAALELNAIQMADHPDDICERSPAIQKKLLDDVFHLTSCSKVSSRDLLGITDLSVSSPLKAGDLDGFRNLHTLRIRTDTRPPAALLADTTRIRNFLLEYPAGYCGGTFEVNGVPREVYRSGDNCRVAFGDN